MKALARCVLAAAITSGFATLAAGAAGAAPPPIFFPGGGNQAVFVQTDGLTGNQVVAYSRGPNGALTLANTYSTDGLGGQLTGSVVDHLASQDSLVYDQADSALYAVNAGSNTVSVFAVRGTQLTLDQVVSSGGTFPVSVAVHGHLVYVLNAENGGSVQGYIASFGHLFPLPGSSRSLNLNPTATPQFTNTPGQVAFSPDGSKLIVTTKANGSDIDVFGVLPNGWLSASPVVNSEPGAVPFSVTFDPFGNLVVAEAGTNALATFALGWNGTLYPLANALTGQMATCWVAQASGFYFASNAGSASVSGFQESFHGQLNPLGNTTTDPGTVDAAASPDGHYLYVQTGGNGIVDEFQVGFNGSLSEIGSVTVAGAAGGEGIVAV